MTPGTRVQLTPTARAVAWRYADIGDRIGTVRGVGKWFVVEFDGRNGRIYLPTEDVEKEQTR